MKWCRLCWRYSYMHHTAPDSFTSYHFTSPSSYTFHICGNHPGNWLEVPLNALIIPENSMTRTPIPHHLHPFIIPHFFHPRCSASAVISTQFLPFLCPTQSSPHPSLHNPKHPTFSNLSNPQWLTRRVYYPLLTSLFPYVLPKHA